MRDNRAWQLPGLLRHKARSPNHKANIGLQPPIPAIRVAKLRIIRFRLQVHRRSVLSQPFLALVEIWHDFALARLFWVIHERGDEAQRARLKEIVRTPKMQSIIRQHDPFLLRDLGLGPARMASIKITKRDRPWHIEDCKVTCPFEEPEKVKKPEPVQPKQLPYYPPPAAPDPPRRGYWNKWSHFHR